ncbi:MAG: SPOR domain-containing protein [Pseudomonadota bacterium]
MSNKPSATKIDTVIKLILIFCITLLSFSLGTFVGKQVSDSEYRKAAIEGDYDYLNAKNDDAEVMGEEELSQKDIDSLTDEFLEKESREIASEDKKAMAKEKKPEMKSAKASESLKKYVKASPEPKKEMKKEMPKAPPSMAKKDKMDAPSDAAKRVSQNKAPSKTMKNKRKPQSILPSVASSAVGKYTVQVASYASEQEAKVHSANLKEKGWNAFYVPASVRGRQWYRVSVGLFSTSTSAEKFKRDLVKDNAVNSAYVQKIVK